MQKERLTLKLPMEPLVLTHAGEMLLSMAGQMAAAELPPAPAAAPAAELPPAPAAAPAADLPPPAADLPPPAAPSGVELDSERLPWDARIHAKNKGKDANGKWKYLRGVDRVTLVPAVEAELRAVMAVPPAGTVPPPDAVPPAGTVPPPDAVPPAGTVPPPPVDTSTTELPAMDFPGIVNKVTALQNAGRITPEQIQAVVIAAGLPSFPLLGSRPDLIPAVNVEIDKLCPPTQ